ncbi:hypothetical protein B0T26DRAFT_714493 [Lasiosphaeria miniovina]|uniref:Uncharacterized protein n=1 Tax=Lasiosphaeria miniovina TaxID=1954250 RepID=A0AA40AAV8_9PEZI|nr:uncharacterized protein B0T26DRAFT_714493 [Lasiosphaeria miniovina]KAK0712499.1 hypothetical protein B0T26DRAFT_714493 [Lasiosphaeria miniovina]
MVFGFLGGILIGIMQHVAYGPVLSCHWAYQGQVVLHRGLATGLPSPTVNQPLVNLRGSFPAEVAAKLLASLNRPSKINACSWKRGASPDCLIVFQVVEGIVLFQKEKLS